MGFAENLHVLMVDHDLQGQDIAEIAGVTPSSVSGWRSGSIPRRGAIEKLCEYFGLEYDDLMSDTNGLAAKKYGRFLQAQGYQIPAQHIPNQGWQESQIWVLSPDEEQLLMIYRGLKAVDRGRLLGFAEGLAAAGKRPPGGRNQVSA